VTGSHTCYVCENKEISEKLLISNYANYELDNRKKNYS
jgi:hypothetical protein